MNQQSGNDEQNTLSARQNQLIRLWEAHVGYEFESRKVEATLQTMLPRAYVNHIPVMTGGSGHDELAAFYGQQFIPQMPDDTRMTLISRTVDDNRVVDEMLFEFTHTVIMDWMLPGIEPTGLPVKVALVAIVGFEGDKLTHEHIYWDQATVLVQLGLLDPAGLPVSGVESALKAMNPSLPSRRP